MQKQFENLRIVRLEAENVKRLRAVSITPDGSVVEITGENGQGKTSILDSIWWLFSGERGIQAKPIAKGKSEAIIRADLGGLIVARTFRESAEGKITTTVRVESPEGAVYPRAQEMLTSLIGNLTFDPLAFTRQKPKEQFDALRVFVPDFDFEQHAAHRQGIFDKRTDISRRAREAAARATGIRLPEKVGQEIDEAELVAELERAGQVNADIETRKARRQAAERQIENATETAKRDRERAVELRQQAEAMDRQAEQQEAHVAELQTRLAAADPLPEPVDTAAVRQQIADAKTHNAAVSLAKLAVTEQRRLADEAKAYQQEAEDLTADLAAMDKAKADAIAAAKMPVEGLTFGEGEILFNGSPFEQASMAEQIRTSVAIAMAGNPALRVARIADGSLLGRAAWDMLVAMADAHKFQVWVETVNSDRPTAILIEDGAVAGEPMPEILKAETAPKPRARKAQEPLHPSELGIGPDPVAKPPVPAEGLPWAEPTTTEPAAPKAPSRRTLFEG